MNEQYNPYSGGKPASCSTYGESARGMTRLFLSTYAGIRESLGYVDYRDGQTCDHITVKPSGIFGGQNRSE